MQHLKIAQLESGIRKQKKAKSQGDNEKKYIQLIPLTPTTSFNVKLGCGTADERALICAMLEKINVERKLWDAGNLRDLMAKKVKDFGSRVGGYRAKIDKINKSHQCGYPANFIKELSPLTESDVCDGMGQREMSRRPLQEIVNDLLKNNGDSKYIQELRGRFAYASVRMLKPDLIIMDEFQRFSTLISPDDANSESGILAREFLSGDRDGSDEEGRKNHKTRVLLLSATPYKSFSTRDEVDRD